LKILYLYKDYYPVLGGIENYTRQLAEAMLARGHEVEVLVTNTARTTRQEQVAGVPVLKTGRWVNISSAPLSPRLGLEYLRRLYGAGRPDIVHLQFPYPPGELVWLLGSYLPSFGRLRPRTVLTYHSDIVRQKRLLTFYNPFLRQVLRRVDVILPTSPNYIESSDYLRPLAAKCRVVPLGLDYTRFSQAQPTAALRDQPGPLVLFVGRLRYYKGLQYLIEAMPQVRPDARLLIVGTGPMENALRAQVARLNLGERVSFAGDVADTDLPGYYAAADIFVLPSCERSEAFGVVQLEAMAAARPVISTELGTGTSYVNQPGETGLVVPPADPVALAQALNSLLTDPQKRATLGRRGQARVQAEFSLEKMSQRVEAIYMELSSGGN
jgi:glycosyltransferase involved in cell wall biosynthesis